MHGRSTAKQYSLIMLPLRQRQGVLLSKSLCWESLIDQCCHVLKFGKLVRQLS
jgi:hypothetical protein